MWELIGVIKQDMSKVLLKSIPEVILCGTNPVTPTGCDSSGKSKLSLHHGIWEQWLYRTMSQDFVVDLSLSHMHLWCFHHLLEYGSLHSAEEATWQHSMSWTHFTSSFRKDFLALCICGLSPLQLTTTVPGKLCLITPPSIFPCVQYFCSNEMWYCQVLDE